MKKRSVAAVKKGNPVMEGAGVKVIRILNNHDVYDYDPFLMLDVFDSSNPADYIKGFPWHPHRGIETITYLLEGEIDHGDSLGNKGTIYNGDCQWMTAGSGIIHQEMPQATERIRGWQLWLNLPAKHKMTHPAYRDILGKNIPTIAEKDAIVKIIAGEFNGVKGAIEADYVKARLLDVSLEPNATFTIPTVNHHCVFMYILYGKIALEESSNDYIEKQAILFSEGETIVVNNQQYPSRFILFDAPPLKESIAWGGPIVMNTREELHHAFDELNAGTFIKHG